MSEIPDRGLMRFIIRELPAPDQSPYELPWGETIRQQSEQLARQTIPYVSTTVQTPHWLPVEAYDRDMDEALELAAAELNGTCGPDIARVIKATYRLSGSHYTSYSQVIRGVYDMAETLEQPYVPFNVDAYRQAMLSWGGVAAVKPLVDLARDPNQLVTQSPDSELTRELAAVTPDEGLPPIRNKLMNSMLELMAQHPPVSLDEDAGKRRFRRKSRW